LPRRALVVLVALGALVQFAFAVPASASQHESLELIDNYADGVVTFDWVNADLMTNITMRVRDDECNGKPAIVGVHVHTYGSGGGISERTNYSGCHGGWQQWSFPSFSYRNDFIINMQMFINGNNSYNYGHYVDNPYS